MAFGSARRVSICVIFLSVSFIPGFVSLALSSVWTPDEFKLIWLLLVWFVSLISIISSAFVAVNVPLVLLLTLVQCVLPVLGHVVQIAFFILLFLGPGVSLATGFRNLINTGWCLLGFLIKEKLTIVRLIFTSAVQVLDNIWQSRTQFSSMVTNLTSQTMKMITFMGRQFDGQSADWIWTHSEDIGRSFSHQLSQSCRQIAQDYLSKCPAQMTLACQLIFPPPILDKISCPPLVTSACQSHIGNVIDYCQFPEEINPARYIQAIQSSLHNLNRSTFLDIPVSVLSPFSGRIDTFGLANIFLAVRIGFWIAVGVSATAFVFARITLAYRVTRNLHSFDEIQSDLDSNPSLGQKCSKMCPTRAKTLFKILINPQKWAKNASLAFLISIFMAADSILSAVDEFLSQIEFNVPIRGSALVQMNIQGNSTAAIFIKSVLGGFQIATQVCEQADSTSCFNKRYQPVNLALWVALWTLIFIDCLHSRMDQRIEPILRRIGNFIQETRVEVDEPNPNLATSAVPRNRMNLLIDFVNLKPEHKNLLTFGLTADEQRQRTTEFYTRWQPLARWMPVMLANMVADLGYGLAHLSCQLCWDDPTELYCQCALLCRRCSRCVHQSGENTIHCPICQADVVDLIPG